MGLINTILKFLGGGLRRAARFDARGLSEAEKSLARRVFADSLPYDSVYLSNEIGLEQRQYTIPRLSHKGSFVINIGPRIYADATDSSVIDNEQSGDAIFIHELTHVWQGVHRKSPFDYIGDSVYNQLRYRDKAYAVDSARVGASAWDSFNAEQQATIVEDWYIAGMKESDPAFVYIRDHIRAGKV
jgi:hypothetical protein